MSFLLDLQEGVEGGVEMVHCTRPAPQPVTTFSLREWPAFDKMSRSWWVMGRLVAVELRL